MSIPSVCGGETRLVQVAIIDINPQYPPGATLLHLDGIEPAIAADIENACAAQILGMDRGDVLPLTSGKSPRK